MADVTISGLGDLTPSANTYIPLSNGTTTGKALTNSLPGITPIGGIIMWSGTIASIPSGWALCNGQVSNGQTTPDLRDRFIVGAGSAYAPSNIGGSSAVTPAGTVGDTTLTTAQIPAHTHSSAIEPCGNQTTGYGLNQTGGFRNRVYVNGGVTATNAAGEGGSHNHTFTGTSQTNLPPYYALAYIMRTI